MRHNQWNNGGSRGCGSAWAYVRGRGRGGGRNVRGGFWRQHRPWKRPMDETEIGGAMDPGHSSGYQSWTPQTPLRYNHPAPTRRHYYYCSTANAPQKKRVQQKRPPAPEHERQQWSTKRRRSRYRAPFTRYDDRGTDSLRQAAASSTTSFEAGPAPGEHSTSEHCTRKKKSFSAVGTRSSGGGATPDGAATSESLSLGKRQRSAAARDLLEQKAGTSNTASSEAGPAQVKRLTKGRKPALVGAGSTGGATLGAAAAAVASPGKQQRLPAVARDLLDARSDHADSVHEAEASSASLQQEVGKPAAENPGSPRMTSATKVGSSYAELRTYKIPKINRPSPLKEHGNFSRSPPLVQVCHLQPPWEQGEASEDSHKAGSTQNEASGESEPPSRSLVDKIMDDMDKAFPRITAGFLACDDPISFCRAMQASEIYRSPVRRPLDTEIPMPVKLKISLNGASRQKDLGSRICILCGRRNVSEGNSRGTCIRCSLCEEVTRHEAAMKNKATTGPECDTTPTKRCLRRMSSDVENKVETVAPSSVQGTSVTPPRKKRIKLKIQRSSRKMTYVSKPVITSSEESENESGHSGAANSWKAKKVGTIALPCKPQGSGDSSEKGLHPRDKSPDSQDVTHFVRTVKKMTAVWNSRRGRLKGSHEQYVRRKEMRVAWKKAKNTDEYLRVLSAMQKKKQTVAKVTRRRQSSGGAEKLREPEKGSDISVSAQSSSNVDTTSFEVDVDSPFMIALPPSQNKSQTVDEVTIFETVTTCDEVAEPEEVSVGFVSTPSCTDINTAAVKVEADAPSKISDVSSQPALVISSCRSLSIIDWENQEVETVDTLETEINIGGESNHANKTGVPASMTVLHESDSKDCKTDLQRAQSGQSSIIGDDSSEEFPKVEHESIVVHDSSDECTKEQGENLEDERLKKKSWKRLVGLPLFVALEEDGTLSVRVKEGLSDEDDGGFIENTTSAQHEESSAKSVGVNLQKQVDFYCPPPLVVDLHIMDGEDAATHGLDMPADAPHLPVLRNNKGNQSNETPCPEQLASCSDHLLPSSSEIWFGAVSLADCLFAIKSLGATKGDLDNCSMPFNEVRRLLGEYVCSLENFFGALYSCKQDVRVALVDALLPDGVIKLKKILRIILKMECRLGYLGFRRVWNLEQSLLLVLSEYAEHLSEAVETEPDLPSYMSFELPGAHSPSGDQPSGIVADGVDAQNGKKGSGHEARGSPVNDAADATGQLKGGGDSRIEEVADSVQELRSPEVIENDAARARQLLAGAMQGESVSKCGNLSPGIAQTAVNSTGNHGKTELEHQAQCSPVNPAPDDASHHPEGAQVLAPAAPSSSSLNVTEGIAAPGVPQRQGTDQQQLASPHSSLSEVAGKCALTQWKGDDLEKQAQRCAGSPASGASHHLERANVLAPSTASSLLNATEGVATPAAPQSQSVDQERLTSLHPSHTAESSEDSNGASELRGLAMACGVAAPTQSTSSPGRAYTHHSGGFTLQMPQAGAANSAACSEPFHGTAPSEEPSTNVEQSVSGGSHCLGQSNVAPSKNQMPPLARNANSVSEDLESPQNNSPSNLPQQQIATATGTWFPGNHQGCQVRRKQSQPPPLLQRGPSPPLQQQTLTSMSPMQRDLLSNQVAAYTRWLNSNRRASPDVPLDFTTQSHRPDAQQAPPNAALGPEHLVWHERSSSTSEQGKGGGGTMQEEVRPPLPHPCTAGPPSRQIPPLHRNAPVHHDVSRLQPDTGVTEARQPYKHSTTRLQQQRTRRGKRAANTSSSSVHTSYTSQETSRNQATTVTEQGDVPQDSAAQRPNIGRGPIVNQTRDAALKWMKDYLHKNPQRWQNVKALLACTSGTGQSPLEQMGPTGPSVAALLETEGMLGQQMDYSQVRLSASSSFQSRQQETHQARASFQQPQQHHPQQYPAQSPQVVRPWEGRPTEKPRWPYPYSACQEALARYKEQQCFENTGAHVANMPYGVLSSADVNSYQALPPALWQMRHLHASPPSLQAPTTWPHLPALPGSPQSK